jgi:hypothetical protein
MGLKFFFKQNKYFVAEFLKVLSSEMVLNKVVSFYIDWTNKSHKLTHAPQFEWPDYNFKLLKKNDKKRCNPFHECLNFTHKRQ